MDDLLSLLSGMGTCGWSLGVDDLFSLLSGMGRAGIIRACVMCIFHFIMYFKKEKKIFFLGGANFGYGCWYLTSPCYPLSFLPSSTTFM